jgi:Flagellar transcriptional activator (FlhC)
MQTENRYSRQLRRYAFALRLIRHNARTQTILAWSGLSTYRIRALYRANGPDQSDPGRRRLRGRAPYQLQFFWRSPRRAVEAATLGGIARLLNVIPAEPIQKRPVSARSLQEGEGVCRAYEVWHAYVPESDISIDHAFLLVTALGRGEEIRLGHCACCNGLFLIDCLKSNVQCCEFCESAQQDTQPRARGRG